MYAQNVVISIPPLVPYNKAPLLLVRVPSQQRIAEDPTVSMVPSIHPSISRSNRRKTSSDYLRSLQKCVLGSLLSMERKEMTVWREPLQTWMSITIPPRASPWVVCILICIPPPSSLPPHGLSPSFISGLNCTFSSVRSVFVVPP